MAVKPPPPQIKHIALIDPSTGVIMGYASGTNVVVGRGEGWRDVTEITGGKHLGKKDISSVLIKRGNVVNKPKVKIVTNAGEVEVDKIVKISLEKDGPTEFLPDEVEVAIGNRRLKLKFDEEIEIKPSKLKSFNIIVVDPLVHVNDNVKRISVIPKGGKPPNDDGLTINKKKK